LTRVLEFDKVGESKNMTKAEKIKYLLTPAIGFGLGGALWGWRWFGFWTGSAPNDFGIISGAILLGLFGSLSLIVFLEYVKPSKKAFIVLGGAFLWGIGLYVWGASFLFLALIFPPGIVLLLLLLGILLALFYALVLKVRIWPIIWRGGAGIVLGFIIGPTSGSLIGHNLLNSSIIAEIFSFTFVGIILGLFLGWGLYKGQKPK